MQSASLALEFIKNSGYFDYDFNYQWECSDWHILAQMFPKNQLSINSVLGCQGFIRSKGVINHNATGFLSSTHSITPLFKHNRFVQSTWLGIITWCWFPFDTYAHNKHWPKSQRKHIEDSCVSGTHPRTGMPSRLAAEMTCSNLCKLSSMEQLMFFLLKVSEAEPNTATSVAPAATFNRKHLIKCVLIDVGLCAQLAWLAGKAINKMG